MRERQLPPVNESLVVSAPTTPQQGAFRLSGRPALYLLASLIVSLLAPSSAPTPLYASYQAQWGFTPITTPVVFGVYARAVLAAVLKFERPLPVRVARCQA